MAAEIEHPHDRLFRAVFSDAKETADLLRSALPRDVSDKVHWDSLRLIDGTFIDDALRESETDLLFEAGYGDKVRPVRFYLLFEHQSTPDAWMRFRLLKYCCRIWDAERRDEPGLTKLSPILPLVLYQGSRGWQHSTEFADLFREEVRGWPWVPRFEHVLMDQTELEPESVEGGVAGRIAQLLMMAAAGRHARAALEGAAGLLASLGSGGAGSPFGLFVLYVMATQDRATWETFTTALKRRESGQEGDTMAYAHELLAEGREEGKAQGLKEGMQRGIREGIQQGVRHGKVETVEGFLKVGVAWDVIESATGLDEARFRTLKERLAASSNSTVTSASNVPSIIATGSASTASRRNPNLPE